MAEKLQQIHAAYTRLEMTTDVLMSLVERTGQFTEGYYALKVLNEHAKLINNAQFASTAETPEEAMDLLLQQLQNMTATVESQIGRLE